MKRVILFLLGALLSVVGMTQNGGQSSENASVKLEFVALAANNHAIVRVTNKQSCTANMKVTYGSTSQTKSMLSLQSDTFLITVPSNGKVRAKSLTNCGSNQGEVEITLSGCLPIEFEYLKATRLDEHTIQVEFKASDVGNEQQFNIQFSDDGKTFRTVMVVLPKPITENQIYQLKIKL